MVVRPLVMLALLGCGRVGFDGVGDASMTSDDGLVGATSTITLEVPTFSTSSGTFVDVAGGTLTIPASPNTRWVLLTTAGLESTITTGLTVEARYMLDGVERGIGGTVNLVPGKPGPWMHADVIDGTSAPQQLVYQLRDIQAATAAITNLRAIAVPLPAAAVHVARADAIQSVTSGTTQAVHSQYDLGVLDGDFVFIMNLNGTELPSSSSLFLEWRGPSSEVWMTETHIPRGPWQSILVMARAVLAQQQAVVRLLAWGGSPPASVRNVRVIAIDTKALASVAFSASNTRTPTTLMSPTVPITLTPSAVAEAREHLFIGTMRLRGDCNVTGDAERVAHARFDGTFTHSHVAANCGYCASYGDVRLVRGVSSPIGEIGYSSSNGLPVHFLGGSVAILSLF